ncbi:MAG: NAD-dependent succinate-semialdehyde dehydrogenase [Verrucomicrobiales bacterium]|nr:NAD-dependent succinate-semialdehyde dehydrogenase [Verrucomicrobiales bacterium]
MDKYFNYINGEWIGGDLPQAEVINPSSGEAFATVPRGGKPEAIASVDAADSAFRSWADYSAYERSTILQKWHDLIDQNIDEIAQTMTREQGKPLKEAAGEMRYANGFLEWYAEEGKRVYGDMIPASQRDKRMMILKQPVGVVAVITPWNFPAAMISRKVAPALAVGCTVVIKPAMQTPLTAIKMVKLAEEAGFPKGVINIVTGKASEIGDAWLSDPRVRKLTFTGSTEIGKILMKQSADTVKRISMELGGHAPVIVFEDADIPKAVEGVIAAKFRNAGQTCICANRIYVHDSIHDAFVEQFVSEAASLVIGDGLDPNTDIGPLIDEPSLQKVLAQIEDAQSRGACIKTGGKAREGLFLEPTVLTEVTDEMVCMNEETFGPVAPITRFSTEEEVIQRANDSIYGLSAYVFTESLKRGLRAVEALEYGIVGLNDGLPSAPQAPFGGMKESGIGREGGKYGLEEYLETKYVSIGL